MDHATQVRLIHNVLGLIHAGRTDMVEREFRQPVEAYVSAPRLQREMDRLYRRQPLILGRSEQIANPGDFFTHDHYGLPLLVTRSDDGRLHVLLNVCRHRGTRVVNAGHGCRKVFVCPYHAWNYDCAGRLIRVSDEEGFPGLDRSRHGLVPLPAVERHGFIWSVLSPEAELDGGALAAWLGTLDRDFESFDLAGHFLHRPVSLRFRMNWKLAFDIFLEAYHLRYVHSRSIYPMFYDNLGVFERFAPHMRNLFPKRSIESLRGSAPSGWDLRSHSNILYTLFPNTLMLVQPDHFSMFHVFPEGTAACRMQAYSLLPEPPKSEKATSHWQKNLEILMHATLEDFAMGESIQQGLDSGANQYFTFGRYEQSLAWFHESIAAALAVEQPERVRVLA